MNTIKKLRQERELTQVQLAQILNIDQTTISKWELQKALPDTQMLIQLASFFDVSIDYLLGLSTYFYPDKVKAFSSNENLSSDERQLIRDYRELAPYLREMLQATIQTWKGTKANERKTN